MNYGMADVALCNIAVHLASNTSARPNLQAGGGTDQSYPTRIVEQDLPRYASKYYVSSPVLAEQQERAQDGSVWIPIGPQRRMTSYSERTLMFKEDAVFHMTMAVSGNKLVQSWTRLDVQYASLEDRHGLIRFYLAFPARAKHLIRYYRPELSAAAFDPTKDLNDQIFDAITGQSPSNIVEEIDIAYVGSYNALYPPGGEQKLFTLHKMNANMEWSRRPYDRALITTDAFTLGDCTWNNGESDVLAVPEGANFDQVLSLHETAPYYTRRVRVASLFSKIMEEVMSQNILIADLKTMEHVNRNTLTLASRSILGVDVPKSYGFKINLSKETKPSAEERPNSNKAEPEYAAGLHADVLKSEEDSQNDALQRSLYCTSVDMIANGLLASMTEAHNILKDIECKQKFVFQVKPGTTYFKGEPENIGFTFEPMQKVEFLDRAYYDSSNKGFNEFCRIVFRSMEQQIGTKTRSFELGYVLRECYERGWTAAKALMTHWVPQEDSQDLRDVWNSLPNDAKVWIASRRPGVSTRQHQVNNRMYRVWMHNNLTRSEFETETAQ